jgi:hypothetical protein
VYDKDGNNIGYAMSSKLGGFFGVRLENEMGGKEREREREEELDIFHVT